MLFVVVTFLARQPAARFEGYDPDRADPLKFYPDRADPHELTARQKK
jgi:hypothetical protein